MRLDVITIFPDYLQPLHQALLGTAIEQGYLEVEVHNLRDWATGNHKAVDDTPYGGGPGMVMKPEVWGPALDDIRQRGPGTERPLLIVPTPAGRPFVQADAQRWAQRSHLIFACGRYEGIDHRVIEDAAETCDIAEVSIGDYVLIGGEVAVLVITEAIARLIPGVLGNERSYQEDSFSPSLGGLLEGPSYTKPRRWRGRDVPDILNSGNHQAIATWRREQSLARSAERRPDLIEAARRAGHLSPQDEFYLASEPFDMVIAHRDPAAQLPRFNAKTRRALKRQGIEVREATADPAGIALRGRTTVDAAELQAALERVVRD